YLLTGFRPSPVLEYPSYGSVLAQARAGGADLPSYIAVPRASRQAGSGFLPGTFGPFELHGDPSRPDFRVRDLEAPSELAPPGLGRRPDFRGEFDRLSAEVEDNAMRRERDAQFEQAYRLVFSSQARRAFNLALEAPALRQRYGMHRIGQSCLLARRLIEAG